MTTFKAPLRVWGDDKDINVDTGDVVITQSLGFIFSETTINLFILPTNARILDFTIDVEVAFNSGTSNILDIGVASDQALYADDINLQTQGRSLASADASKLSTINSILTEPTTIIATHVPAGTAATAGTAVVRVTYMIERELRR